MTVSMPFGAAGRGLAMTLSLALAAGPVLAAGLPSNVADLAYQDSSYSQREMRDRGYTLVHTDFRNGTTWQYWWGASNRACVQVGIRDSKFSQVESTDRTDCNQYYTDDGKDKGEMSDGAKAAIAAAAILGVAALAHKSHDRNNNKSNNNYNSSQEIADFDRGYRDGLHHTPYHNYGNSRAYSDGYSEGMQQRDQETRHHGSHSGRYSGYQNYFNMNQLVGERASSAESTLRERGFRDVDGYKRKNSSHVVWWNAVTRQCLDVKTKEGRIANVETLTEGVCN
jgi:hypothetical protein